MGKKNYRPPTTVVSSYPWFRILVLFFTVFSLFRSSYAASLKSDVDDTADIDFFAASNGTAFFSLLDTASHFDFEDQLRSNIDASDCLEPLKARSSFHTIMASITKGDLTAQKRLQTVFNAGITFKLGGSLYAGNANRLGAFFHTETEKIHYPCPEHPMIYTPESILRHELTHAYMAAIHSKRLCDWKKPFYPLHTLPYILDDKLVSSSHFKRDKLAERRLRQALHAGIEKIKRLSIMFKAGKKLPAVDARLIEKYYKPSKVILQEITNQQDRAFFANLIKHSPDSHAKHGKLHLSKHLVHQVETTTSTLTAYFDELIWHTTKTGGVSYYVTGYTRKDPKRNKVALFFDEIEYITQEKIYRPYAQLYTGVIPGQSSILLERHANIANRWHSTLKAHFFPEVVAFEDADEEKSADATGCFSL